jgi:hypothetical protein
MTIGDEIELGWWRHFRAKCFNNIPVGHVLLGDRFKIMVESPLTGEWEDVWQPRSQPDPPVDSSTAETPQSLVVGSGERCGSPPIPE